jgi:hypothetical protein
MEALHPGHRHHVFRQRHRCVARSPRAVQTQKHDVYINASGAFVSRAPGLMDGDGLLPYFSERNHAPQPSLHPNLLPLLASPPNPRVALPAVYGWPALRRDLLAEKARTGRACQMLPATSSDAFWTLLSAVIRRPVTWQALPGGAAVYGWPALVRRPGPGGPADVTRHVNHPTHSEPSFTWSTCVVYDVASNVWQAMRTGRGLDEKQLGAVFTAGAYTRSLHSST